MPRESRSLPRHAVTLGTYADLVDRAKAFAAGHLRNVLLIGPPGTGKSTVFRDAVGTDARWIAGNATAFGIYLAAYASRDKPLVLDDIDDLHRDMRGIRLLKALCQSEAVKTVSWTTQAAELDRLGVPREYQTSSGVALIANEWATLGPNVAAVEDRLHLFVFEPSALEIHKNAATWFWDQEIFDFVAAHLPLIEDHSLRLYQRAHELKRGDFNWREAVLAACYSGATRVVAQLKADPKFLSEEDRVRAFVDGGHGSRATYYNHARRIAPVADVQLIPLTATAPPGAAPELPSLPEFLRRRHWNLGNG